jgi:hypothetical protein
MDSPDLACGKNEKGERAGLLLGSLAGFFKNGDVFSCYEPDAFIRKFSRLSPPVGTGIKY